MLGYLLHTKPIKVNNVYLINVRTLELKKLLEETAERKGLRVEISLSPAPKYHKTKEDYLQHLLESNEDFKEFYNELGLKLIP